MPARVVYIEESVRDHPRVRRICERLGSPDIVWCDRYPEVFNPRAQNFRLQKRNPALILARKHDGFVMKAPAAHGVGGGSNFYFSHMLNCVYDCRYCFLQGMFRSAHYVLFVNYEDFAAAIASTLTGIGDGGESWFFSGYDCDSLAFEPMTGFAASFVPLFQAYPRAVLELRTKSTQVRQLLGMKPLPNVVVAFSFTPEPLSAALEHGVPSVGSRLRAMARLQSAGWQVGLRIDPLVYHEGYRRHYSELVGAIFATVDPARVHSVGLGSFRMPKGFLDNIVRLYPDDPLYASPLDVDEDATAAYAPAIRNEMLDHVSELLLKWVPPERLFIHDRQS